MDDCNNCGHAEMAHRKATVGTSTRTVCGVAGCECVL